MPYFIKCFKNCDTFGDLRFILYTSHGHILRSHYVAFNCSNLISAPDTNLNPVEFDGNSILIQYRYTTRDVYCFLWLQEKRHWKMSVQQVSYFMHRILQVQWRRMLYLSLQIGSVKHCKSYANFCKWAECRDIYGKVRVREIPYISIF